MTPPTSNNPNPATAPRESSVLPPGLPIPQDDGAAGHIEGMHMPSLALPATDGSQFWVHRPPAGFERLVLYTYPRTNRPGEPPLSPDWDDIPGARGCTPETCAFRDHAVELAARGAAVAGVSTQDTDYQREVVDRLQLPFPLLSDAEHELMNALRLPVHRIVGRVLLRRLTMIVRDGRIERVFYPVFPPDAHAADMVRWLEENRIEPRHG
jgi:peroxiredoxin